MHADTWIKQLGSATEESITRLQNSLDSAFPYALGIFEPSTFEKELVEEGIFAGENILKAHWLEKTEAVIAATDLNYPDIAAAIPETGGRYGKHTEYLQPLLDEMSEVYNLDPAADW